MAPTATATGSAPITPAKGFTPTATDLAPDDTATDLAPDDTATDPVPHGMSTAPAPHDTARGPAALVELRIRDLGVIADAELRLGPGLTVLTGETGAGKTMVVTALLLLFGGRAEAQRVRPGAERAVVDGRLALSADHPAVRRVLDAGGDLDDDGTLTLRRVVAANGRSRAFAGGAPVPVGVLSDLAADVVAVHGQTDQLRLTRPAEQRASLDRFAAAHDRAFAATAARWSEAYARWRDAEQALRDRRARAGELRREADFLRHGLSEIERAAPQPGEDLELATREERLGHLDALREAAHTAHDAVAGDPDDPAGSGVDVATLLGRARWALDHAGVGDADPRITGLSQQLAGLAAAATDIGTELSALLADLDAEGADPLALARVQERRHALAGLVRSYTDPYADPPTDGVDGVLAWANAARTRLGDLDVSDEALAGLAATATAARTAAATAAAALSAARTRSARKLSAAVTAELAGLAMAAAAVEVTVTPRTAPDAGAAQRPEPDPTGTGSLELDSKVVHATVDGTDEIAIVLRPHPEAPALPVHRGASGGELSRVMLALEAVLAETDPVPLLVFDEVDAGVGGRAAVEVGARLARLGSHHQVLVVTHLAQVAAAGDGQVVVTRGDGAVSRADVVALAADGRTSELARMLSGQDTPTARRHAEELLWTGQQARTVPAP
ncbi:DNA repair protein RecN [Jatrophihabitans sp. YIM 134969]